MDAESQIYAHTAQVIRKGRKRQGISQATLAEKLGMHQTAIAKIENNERRVDFATVMRISEILGIPWSEFHLETPNDEDKLEEIATRILHSTDNITEVSNSLSNHLMNTLLMLIEADSEIFQIRDNGNLDMDKWGEITSRLQELIVDGKIKISTFDRELTSSLLGIEEFYGRAFNTLHLIKKVSNSASS